MISEGIRWMNAPDLLAALLDDGTFRSWDSAPADGTRDGGRPGLSGIARRAVSRLSSEVREAFILSAPHNKLTLPQLAEVIGVGLDAAADLRAQAGLDFVRAVALSAQEAGFTEFAGADLRIRAEESLAHDASEPPPSLPAAVLENPTRAALPGPAGFRGQADFAGQPEAFGGQDEYGPEPDYTREDEFRTSRPDYTRQDEFGGGADYTRRDEFGAGPGYNGLEYHEGPAYDDGPAPGYHGPPEGYYGRRALTDPLRVITGPLRFGDRLGGPRSPGRAAGSRPWRWRSSPRTR
jgi:hypothetical protein